MLGLILLAAMGQAPAAEWRPLTTDPRYEVSGRMERGTFRYDPATKRPRAAKPAPSVNYGLNLPQHEPVLAASDFEVRGTDRALGETMASAATTPIASAAPCPRPGPCPKPDPTLPHVPHPARAVEHELVIVVCLVALGAITVFVVLGLVGAVLFTVCRVIWRALSAPPTP